MKTSVIIPSINSWHLPKALESVFAQEKNSADEIIIVSGDIGGANHLQSERIKIVHTKCRLNPSSARNLGASVATGEILLFLDDDCRAQKNWISANLEALGENNVGAAGGRILGQSGRYFARCTDLAMFWPQQNNIKRFMESLYSASLGVRRDLFQELNGFDETLDVAEDTDFCSRIIKNGLKCLYFPDITVYHDHKRDNFAKSVEYMYFRGREFCRANKYDIKNIGFFCKIFLIFKESVKYTHKTFIMNRGHYRHIFIYLPGIFIDYMAWNMGIYSKKCRLKAPDTLIFFITSKCNLFCSHCFYWSSLNQNKDLNFEEIREFSLSMGKIKNLALSGGEPFLRQDIVEICALFKNNNQIDSLSIPTNGTLPGIIYERVKELLEKTNLNITINLSIDGMREYHDRLRGAPGVFDKAIKTYQALAELKKKFNKLKITINPTVTKNNVEEIIKLAGFAREDMPDADYFWLCFVRGNTKCPEQILPDARPLRKLNNEIDRIFYKGRNIPTAERRMWDNLFDIKIKTLSRKSQAVPCSAGINIGVLDSEGSVRLCELKEPIGNIRKHSFLDIWNSQLAYLVRKEIKNRKCYCTHECFIYPSFMMRREGMFFSSSFFKSLARKLKESVKLCLKKARFGG